MALNEGPYPLTLNVAQLVPNPTASGTIGAPAAQIQNASPFTLEIQTNGLQIIIQPFTAQTITLDGSGSPITALPVAGPGGTQGGLTVVYLNPGESPQMADGQLTGAAQYAEGLGVLLASGSGSVSNFTGPPVTYSFSLSNVAPNLRTLLLRLNVQSFSGGGITGVEFGNVIVTGAQSGFNYYEQPPYLVNNSGTVPWALMIIPISALFDTSFNVSVTYQVTSTGGTSSIVGTYNVWGDTAEYDESVFYNGTPTPFSVTAAGTICTGPRRILEVHLETSASANVYWNGVLLAQAGDGAVAGDTLVLPFPPNTILPAFQTLSVTGGVVVAGALTAYP